MSEPDKRCGCKHPGCNCRFPVEVRWATPDPPEQTVDGAIERVRANVVPEIEMLRDRATITDPAEWEADLTAITRVLSLAQQATSLQERVEEAEAKIDRLLNETKRANHMASDAIAQRAASEQRESQLRSALERAADDLDKAANQFASFHESQQHGHTPEVRENHHIFARKASEARATLNTTPPEPEGTGRND